MEIDRITKHFRYCGEYFDKESGTIYLRARYYSPSIGRFISRDSFAGKDGDPLSLNLYTYCHNNPILRFDPSGHFSLKNTWNAVKATSNALSNGCKSTAMKVNDKVFETANSAANKMKPAIQALALVSYYETEKVRNFTSKFNAAGSNSSSFNVSVGPINFSVGGGYCIDSYGNWGYQASGGVSLSPNKFISPEEALESIGKTTGTPSVSLTGNTMITNAKGINGLEGVGTEQGGSINIPIPRSPVAATVGAGIVEGYDDDGNIASGGLDLSYGAAYPPTAGYEVHNQVSYTKVFPQGNVYDTYENFLSQIIFS